MMSVNHAVDIALDQILPSESSTSAVVVDLKPDVVKIISALTQLVPIIGAIV